MDNEVYTLEDFLRGTARANVTDDALKSICARMGIPLGCAYSSLSEKQCDIATAWLYVWLSSSPSTTQKVSDKDGDWSHSEGGESNAASNLREYLKMANHLFSKWGEPTINSNRWSMIVGGFHDKRNYGGRQKRM